MKEWVADFQGHSIRVTNTWLGGTKLYIDGNCRDTNNDMFAVSSTKVRLTARIDSSNPTSALVEVFFKAILAVNAKICVDGKQIGGDFT